MGLELAKEALARHYQLTIVSGPITEKLPEEARLIQVERADQMQRALKKEVLQADVVIMAAAVCDFRPQHPRLRKLKRRSRWALSLEPTQDIVASLPRKRGQVVVGFALETDEVIARAREKLFSKRLDFLLAQRATKSRAAGLQSPFGRQPVLAWLLSQKQTVPLGRVTKAEVAKILFNAIEKNLAAA